MPNKRLQRDGGYSLGSFMENLKLKKLAYYFSIAFVIGAGFTLGPILVIGVYSEFKEDAYNDAYISTSHRHFYDGNTNLAVVDHGDMKFPDECSVDILGTVENNGEYAWENLRFEVEFFNSSGGFVDECFYPEGGRLLPGMSFNFKLECGRCDYRPIRDYDTYKISVVNAGFVDESVWKNEPNQKLQSTADGGG